MDDDIKDLIVELYELEKMGKDVDYQRLDLMIKLAWSLIDILHDKQGLLKSVKEH